MRLQATPSKTEPNCLLIQFKIVSFAPTESFWSTEKLKWKQKFENLLCCFCFLGLTGCGIDDTSACWLVCIVSWAFCLCRKWESDCYLCLAIEIAINLAERGKMVNLVFMLVMEGTEIELLFFLEKCVLDLVFSLFMIKFLVPAV